MDASTYLALVFLLLLSGLFSGAESALFALNRVQVRQLELSGDWTARAVLALLRSPRRLLGALLAGNTVVNIALSAAITAVTLERFGERGLKWAIPLASVVILLGGEILPKAVAVNFPRLVSRLVALPLRVMLPLLTPVSWAATAASRAILRERPAVDGDRWRQRGRVTTSELRAVLEELDDETGMSKLESRLVQNILSFSRTTAEEIMTPRVDITASPVDASPRELRGIIERTKHSRIPLYRGTIDEIVGHLPSREFLLDPTRRISLLIRPVLVVPEKAPLDRIFHDLRKGRWRMAIVVNEYGETVGLFTQEDLIEEVIGELSDEYERSVEEIRPLEDGNYEVRGSASIQDLSAELEVDLPQEQAVTVNGLLCSMYGGFPRPGTRLRWGDLEFEVLEVARHRVARAMVRRQNREIGT
jgi:CBS domain containing-hemolysin-like protein